MAKSKLALKDFLARTCRIHPSPATMDEQEYYILLAADGKNFMTESHLREMLRAVHQSGEVLSAPKKGGDVNNIMVTLKDTPQKEIEKIKIPVALVESLSEKQAFLLLRNVKCIQSDVEDGRIYKDRLEMLFGDTATIRIATLEDGDRVYEITGKLSSTDQRRYMERYAEQIASRTLFDVAKALNGRLSQYIAPEAREKFFLEGRDFSDRKVRYGEEVSTELMLSDEGASVYTTLVHANPHLKEALSKLLQQAMLNPFGLSMTHYMGKHNVLKAGKRPLVKIPRISGFFGWVKSLFNSGK